jgi:formate hydrogenlyase transcriptional activator
MKMRNAPSLLLVDDEHNILNSLARDFEVENYKVTKATSGEEALALLKIYRFHCVITDLKMPGIGGIKVLKEIKEKYPETIVIILTGYGDMNTAIDALRLDADDFLHKPCDFAELRFRMSKCLERQKLQNLYERFLSICSNCQKIRDKADKEYGKGKRPPADEYFKQLEQYSFTHDRYLECFEAVKNDISDGAHVDMYQLLRQQQAFEDLLLEISTRFVNLPAAAVDDAIEDAQHRICETLNLDLSALWQWSDQDQHIMTITHLHRPPDGPERPVDINAAETFPWLLEKVIAGETLAVTTEQLPGEASLDKESRRSFGVKSSVVIPLQEGGNPIMGIVSFDTLHEERNWSYGEVQRLQLVAEIFSNALARKQSEQNIIESEARLALAAESAEAGVWELDCATSIFWATNQARKPFGYRTDETISMELFEQSIHPEDLGRVQQAREEAFKKREKVEVEFRISSGKEGYKWICSKGRPYYHADGTPSRMLGVNIDINRRKQLEDDLKKNLNEVELLKKQLELENYYLREDLRQEQGFEDVIGQSKGFKAVLTSSKQVASTAATVLLLGETGTGKGVIAHAIHRMSDRSEQPLVTVNCAALPSNLIESELFGREKGAFTGADTRQAGRFEVANRGTIFLDEIGEMGLEMQSKLLRVLQEGEFERLGSSESIKVDVRVIAATCRDLREEVMNGLFREDLYYRINVFPITIPPLRQRRDDILPLVHHFVDKYGRKMGRKIDCVPKPLVEKMTNYPWPGNVRELEHMVERGVIISSGNTLGYSDQCFPLPPIASMGGTIKNLQSVEREHIQEVLNQTNWKIEGPGGAAVILNIHPSTLRFKLKKLDIERPS